MQFILGFLLIYSCKATNSTDGITVDYYVHLITNNTARACTYSLPNDASGFRPLSSKIRVYGTFDYIVVGAGSTGAVVASRLSKVKENHVLLLEAGGRETNFTEIPLMAFYLQRSKFNWNFKTTPQTTACLGMIKQECLYPRGKGLGGSSIISALMYVRGNKIDYDNWYTQGNPGWSYEDVLAYFKKSENSQIVGDGGYHRKGGYLNVEYAKPNSKQVDAFVEANLELGRKVVDYNGKEQLGVAQVQFNTINGKRDSTGKAFLVPAKKRPNLKILMHSYAVRILVKRKTKKSYGILFSRKRQLWKVKARKDVIICGGAIGSPQLLMLSGTGPEDHLTRLEIPVVQSLPVGNNFQDHASYYDLHFETNYTKAVKNVKQHVKEYLNNSGLLTFPGNVQGLGFFQTNSSQIPEHPDVELIIFSSNNLEKVISNIHHFNIDYHSFVFKKIDPFRSFGIVVILLHPKSRGTIRLKSKDSYEYPLIDARFLSDSHGEDIRTMYQGIKLALEIVNTHASRKLNTTLLYTALPICQHQKYLSRKFWYCQIRQLTHHLYHPVGTCKMGPDSSKGAVVNHELKVHGIRNLRVADASIIPDIISGHTNAVAIMIGEKVSGMILNRN